MYQLSTEKVTEKSQEWIDSADQSIQEKVIEETANLEEVDESLKQLEREIELERQAKVVKEQRTSPIKRKFETVELEIIDETREQTITEKVWQRLQKKGYLSKSSIPKQNSHITVDGLQEKIELWTNVREKGLYFNQRLLNTHAFCNPLIMNKMISYMELDQYGSNLSPTWFNPKSILSLPSYEQQLQNVVNQAMPTNPKEAVQVSKQQLKSNFQKSQWKSKSTKPDRPKRRI